MVIHRYSSLTSARSPGGASPARFSARASRDIARCTRIAQFSAFSPGSTAGRVCLRGF